MDLADEVAHGQARWTLQLVFDGFLGILAGVRDIIFTQDVAMIASDFRACHLSILRLSSPGHLYASAPAVLFLVSRIVTPWKLFCICIQDTVHMYMYIWGYRGVYGMVVFNIA